VSNAIRDHRYDEALRRSRRKGAQLEAVAPLLTAAHEAGDARATYALATWYLHGRVFKKDIRRSVALLRKAAKHQVPDALYDLAVCYEKGEGVPQNARKAFEFYLRAALEGEKQSVYEVGRCYYHGVGVARDRHLARVWLDRAEELGIST
jgi:TPR repeat protein